MNRFNGTIVGWSAAEKAGTSKERKDSRKFDASITVDWAPSQG